jgi:hypothetical protein
MRRGLEVIRIYVIEPELLEHRASKRDFECPYKGFRGGTALRDLYYMML